MKGGTTKRFLVGERGPEFVMCKVHATVAIDDVVRAFYDDVAVDDRYWWWVRQVLLDPNELIVDDEDGNLYRVALAVNDEEITFSEPQSVKIQYVDASLDKKSLTAVAAAGIAAVRGAQVAASYGSRDESRQKVQAKEGRSMDVNQLRLALGLPEGTSDDDVLKAAAERLASAPAASADADAGTEADGAAAGSEGTGDAAAAVTPDPAPTAASGAVTVDRSALEELQRQAQLGATAHETMQAEGDKTKVAAAIRSGKFPKSQEAHYLTLLKKDRENGVTATSDFIDSLEENVIPVKLRGNDEQQGAEGEQNLEVGYPAHWLPEVTARKKQLTAMAEAGQTRRIFKESMEV